MTLHRWRKRSLAPRAAPAGPNGPGQLDQTPHASRIAELQLENSRLRRLVTDLLLEKVKLEEAFQPGKPRRASRELVACGNIRTWNFRQPCRRSRPRPHPHHVLAALLAGRSQAPVFGLQEIPPQHPESGEEAQAGSEQCAEMQIDGSEEDVDRCERHDEQNRRARDVDRPTHDAPFPDSALGNVID
jgi:hypothetical protein